MVTTNGKTSKENPMNKKANQQAAQKERAEQIVNARAAYKRGDITLADLLWYAVITLKYVMGLSK
jgi:hypothetical protein